MRSPHHEALDRWLAAERDERAEEAEAALLALFAVVPPLAPPAGFADRVLARVVLEAAPVGRSPFASVWLRSALLLVLSAVGASVLWLPQTLRALAGLLSLGELVRVWTGSVVAACRGLGSALGIWELFFTIGRALATPLETPGVVLAMVLCLLVSVVAFRFLRDLISRDRSWIHVDL